MRQAPSGGIIKGEVIYTVSELSGMIRQSLDRTFPGTMSLEGSSPTSSVPNLPAISTLRLRMPHRASGGSCSEAPLLASPFFQRMDST